MTNHFRFLDLVVEFLELSIQFREWRVGCHIPTKTLLLALYVHKSRFVYKEPSVLSQLLLFLFLCSSCLFFINFSISGVNLLLMFLLFLLLFFLLSTYLDAVSIMSIISSVTFSISSISLTPFLLYFLSVLALFLLYYSFSEFCVPSPSSSSLYFYFACYFIYLFLKRGGLLSYDYVLGYGVSF